MGIIDQFASKFGFISKEKAANQFIFPQSNSSLLGFFSNAGQDIDPKKAMLAYKGWVFACARAIGEEVAKTRFRLFQVAKDGSQEELFNHELLVLINQPNPNMIGWELKFLTAVHLEIVGKAYWYLEGADSPTTKPTGIYPMFPQNMKIITGNFPKLIQSYEYRLDDGQVQNYTTDQVVCIRYPNPNKLLEGFGVVQGIPDWIDTDNFATEFNRKFFENGARIGGFLESADYQSPEMLEYIARAFQDLYTGSKNAHKTVAMPSGTKYTASQQSQKDMDFQEGDKNSRDKILAGFRVPKTVLGLTDDVNRANAEATDFVFANRTIKPKLELITAFLNAYLVPRFGEGLVLDFVDPTPNNKELEIKEDTAALASQPFMTVNEIREQHGLPAIDNGDQVMTDFSKQPLGKTVPSAKRNLPPKSKTMKMPSRQTDRSKGSADALNKIVDEAVKAVGTFTQPIKYTSKMTHEQKEMVWKNYISRVTPYEKAMANAVKIFNGRQLKEVLGNLKNAIKSVKAVNKNSLFNKPKSVQAMIDFSTPILTDLYSTEGVAAYDLLGLSGFSLTPEMKKALQDAIALMSDSYNETTLNKLVDVLDDGITNGASLSDLTSEVQGIYEFSDAYRAEQVARTESFRTANEGAVEAWKQTGVVTSLIWHTADDELVCDACAEMEGTVISIDEKWFEPGDEIGSTTVSDYGPGTAPQDLHPGCRCESFPEDISIE